MVPKAIWAKVKIITPEVARGGPGEFGISVKPIQTMGADYARHTKYCQPPGFKMLSTPL